MLIKIYQGSEHGFFAQSFHYKCDKKGPTISVIKTNTGRLFGGFARKSWSCRNKTYSDNKAFIFSLDRLKHLEIKKGAKIVGCYKKKLVYFLNAICLSDKCNKKLNYLLQKDNQFKTTKIKNIQDFLLGQTDKCFKVQDIEVFSVFIENKD